MVLMVNKTAVDGSVFMKSICRILVPTLMAWAMQTPTLALADDLAKVAENCNDCHGSRGVSQWDDVPTIAGIDAYTHGDALLAYREGDRACIDSKYRRGDTSRPATTMCDVAKSLSEAQIEGIAEHYAALPFVPAKQDFDATLAAKGEAVHKRSCDRCHSDGGSNADDEAGILAGQWMGYMRLAFEQYAADERPQDRKMKEKMDPLSADEVTALLHYYASQQ